MPDTPTHAFNADGSQRLTDGHSVRIPHEPAGREAAINLMREQVEAAYEQAPPHQEQSVATPHQSYSWQQYHNAWQQYYQQYFHRYYLWQLRNQQQQQIIEKAKAALPRLEPVATLQLTPKQQTQESRIAHNRLVATVQARAHRIRHSYWFMPLVSAVFVGSLFLFIQYNQLIIANVAAYISPGSSVNSSDVVLVDPSSNPNVGPEPRLIIPKIDVDTQVFYDITTLDTGPIEAALNNGIVHYNLPGANSLPGQLGNAVFLGHSSNDIFHPGNSKFVFVLLDKMEPGDLFYVNYQGTRYVYRVAKKEVINPSNISALQITGSVPTATLVTCTPIGTALNRLLVVGEQISPNPAAASQPTNSNQNTKNVTVPGTQPTLIDQIFGN